MSVDTLRISLFRSMLRIRMVEEQIAHLYSEQQMRCPVHLSIGQEAVAAATCLALEPGDVAVSGHRAHAHYLAKGGSLAAMLAEIYGRETGCARGRGGSMHLVDEAAGFLGSTPIVAGTVPVGVGVAFADWMQERRRVTMIFFGEGTAEEGVVHESLNFAVLKQLPVVFVCENNLYSVYTPLNERQPDRPLYRWAGGYGMPAATADGNDAVAVYRTTVEAVARARSGGGPTFLEFPTYRWREHCGPNFDNHIGYRTEEEYLEWRERCPVETMQRQLAREGLLDSQRLEDLRATLQGEVDDAVAFAKASPFPDPATAADFVYARQLRSEASRE